jgi:hypothetical protein
MSDVNDPGEFWVCLMDFPGYMISNHGRIKSLPRVVFRAMPFGEVRQIIPEKIMQTPPDSHGYPHLNLRRGGETVRVKVHRLVAKTFIGEPPPGEEVRHLDSNPMNCREDNLIYGTRSQNMGDMVEQGRCKRATINAEIARTIYMSAEPTAALADPNRQIVPAIDGWIALSVSQAGRYRVV